MRNFKVYCLFLVLAVVLIGCAGEEKSPSKTKLTIEYYDMSDKESLLISKTGVDQIEFFKLNGTLKEEDDLQISVEVFENGKFKEELLKSRDELETKFKDSIISFGISDSKDEDDSLKLIKGIPSGRVTKFYSNNMTFSSFGKLIEEKVTLEKNKPVYLTAWIGTTKDELSSGGELNGELPSDIEDTELAFLYKVLWTDK